MRILALTNLYPNPYQPNRATFNRQKLRRLAARHPLAVIAPIAWVEELADRWKGGVRLPRDRRVMCDGITVDHPLYLYPPKVLRGWYGHCFKRSVGPAFARALAEFGPEVVFAPWAYPDGWAAVELSHAAGLPVVIMVHGSDVLRLDLHPGRRQRTIEGLRQADGVVAVSQDLADRVIGLGADPERVRVVYDGVDTELFHPGPADEARARLGLPGDEPIVLFIGNLVPVKGLDVLVDACARLAGDGVWFACYLVGQGPQRRRLEQQVGRLGLEGRVRLVGPRPHQTLPDWYRAATLFVLPSHSEGVPTVLLEAAACGTPFVASRVGGIPEIVHLGSSRLVPPGDAGVLARTLRTCLEGPTARPAAGAAETRSIDAAVSELSCFLEQVVRSRARSHDPALAPLSRG
jgi:glycosyltransferase involved in cell wall biosynthesis